MSQTSSTPTTQELDRAAAALRVRRPDSPALDGAARDRLAEVLADPTGSAWMDRCGLLATDSCGYPVEGGFYDIQGDLRALPQVVADPALGARAIAAVVQAWADEYVLTGRATPLRGVTEVVARLLGDRP